MAYTNNIVFDESYFSTQKDILLQKIDSLIGSLNRINTHLTDLVGSEAWNETEGYAMSNCQDMNGKLITNAENIASIRENINQYLMTVMNNYRF